MEVHFDNKTKIVGCRIISYLLEKSRVTIQAEQERNFHIFYQLLAGADAQTREDLYLSAPEDYHYLSQSGCIQLNGVDDAEEFGETLAAMEKLEFSESERRTLFRIVAAILHLGNLSFIPNADGSGSIIENTDTLEVAAFLLGVRADMLNENLIQRRFQGAGRSSAYSVPLVPEKSKDGRDALCQSLYGFAFSWIVKKINETLSAALDNSHTTVIGVLDIFGFEIFQKNSFEQLCINFANEKLQQHFNAHTFKLEEAVYQSEKIRFTHVEFIDNQVVLDLVEKKPAGIFSLLDEECVMPKATDLTMVQKLNQHHGANKSERFKQNLRAPNKFSVIHYAGEVEYDATGFLDKNKDTLYSGLLELMSISEVSFIADVFCEALKASGESGSGSGGGGPASRGGPPTAGRGGRGGSRGGGGGTSTSGGPSAAGGASGKSRKISLGAQFKDSLNQLMETLSKTEPHYIRCVKPNETKEPCAVRFLGMNVLRQLRYAGVFEAVTIRQTGFPFRLKHEDFYKRYKSLILDNPVNIKKVSFKEAAQKVLDAMNRKKKMPDIQMGVTMVLYRAAQYREIELMRNVALAKTVTEIQAWTRGYRDRVVFERMYHIRTKLREATELRDLATLNAALTYHDNESDFEIVPEFSVAQDLRNLVQEEIRVAGVLCQLLPSLRGNLDPSSDQLQKLDDIVKAINAIEFGSDDALEALALHQLIHRRIEARKNLKKGVQEHDEGLLQQALDEAAELEFPEEEESVVAAQQELERIAQEKEYITALRSALSMPPEGEADLNYTTSHLNQLITISTEVASFGEVVLYEGAWEELEAAVTSAQDFECQTTEGKKLVESGNIVLHLRSAIGQDDWEQVEQLLLGCKRGDADFLFKVVEIKAAQEQLVLRAKKADVQAALDAAAPIFDANSLAMALDKAYGLSMEVESYQILHDHIVATQAALQDALTAVEQEKLEKAIVLADQINYQLEDYVAAVDLRDKLDGLAKELTETLEFMYDREVMDDLYQRAISIGMHTEDLTTLGGFLDLEAEPLNKAQLKSALRRKDHDRIIELNIRLKEIFFQMHEKFFVLSKCGRIKTPSEFVKGKLLGKDKAKQFMLEWNKHPIHAPITRTVTNLHAKEAVIINKNILGYMGDRVMSFPEMLVREILEKGLQVDELRDEIYVQVIKQITNNPNSEGTRKGKKLLELCLLSFPPSPEFENYLEIYFRKEDPSPENPKRRQLHNIVYSGPAAAPPPLDGI